MNRIMVIHGNAQFVSDETLETLIDREFERAETARIVMDATALAHHLGEIAKMMKLRAENLYEAAYDMQAPIHTSTPVNVQEA